MKFKSHRNWSLPVAFICTTVFAVSGWAAPNENAAKPESLPAAAKTKEELEIEKLPPPVENGNAKVPEAGALLESCRKEPGCAKQLAELKSAKPLPAAEGDAPEDIELKKLPEPAQDKPEK